MSWLRVKIGVWLLGPLLREELRFAHRQQAARPDMYWKGRVTGALRIYRALSTRESLLAEAVAFTTKDEQ